MMSEQEYWWNHLTPDQQRFIMDWYEKSYQHVDILFTALQADAYANNERWHNMNGWPETPMRKVA
jgi:hypothetical protein